MHLCYLARSVNTTVEFESDHFRGKEFWLHKIGIGKSVVARMQSLKDGGPDTFNVLAVVEFPTIKAAKVAETMWANHLYPEQRIKSYPEDRAKDWIGLTEDQASIFALQMNKLNDPRLQARFVRNLELIRKESRKQWEHTSQLFKVYFNEEFPRPLKGMTFTPK